MHTNTDLDTAFRCYREALNYVNECNPARAKYKHRIEPENSKSTLIIDDFSGSSATDKFVRVVHAVACVLADEPHERAQAWCWRNLIPRAEGGGLHVDAIAEHLGRSSRTVYRWLDRIDEYMIDVFKRRLLIPCDDPPP